MAVSLRNPSLSLALPLVWLLSDARNDAGLVAALATLPRGSGFVFRHYHLTAEARRERFAQLAWIARDHGHTVVLSANPAIVRDWGADGIYGSGALDPAPGTLRLATAHDAAELQTAIAAKADGVFLSPVFATRSHPDTATLGALGFGVLAQQSPVPVIALGGMTAERARMIDWPRWGAIDGINVQNLT